NIEGAGKAGCSAHPQPRVQIKKHTSKSPQVRRNDPAFPARWFTAYGRALLGVHDLLVTVARAIAKSICPRTWHQPRGARTTRLRRPQSRRSSGNAFASTASPPHVS